MKYAKTDVEHTVADIRPLVTSILWSPDRGDDLTALVEVLRVGAGMLQDRHLTRMARVAEVRRQHEIREADRPRPAGLLRAGAARPGRGTAPAR